MTKPLHASAFAGLAHISSVGAISRADNHVLQDIAEVLKRHGALDRFGVALLHTHFPMGPGEVQVEATDEVARVQTTTPQDLEAVLAKGATPTIVRLTKDGSVIPITMCFSSDPCTAAKQTK
jgi:hypothetical protein